MRPLNSLNIFRKMEITIHIYSMKLEINYKKEKMRMPQTHACQTIWVDEEIKEEIKNYPEVHENRSKPVR